MSAGWSPRQGDRAGLGAAVAVATAGREEIDLLTSILRARSVLAVQDLERSTRYWIDVLGFTEDPINSPGWSFLSRGPFALMLGECRDEVPAAKTGNHSWFVHLLVDDVDGYHREVRARGAEVVNAPTNRPYGLREFVLQTPDGHRLVIGQPIDGSIQ